MEHVSTMSDPSYARANLDGREHSVMKTSMNVRLTTVDVSMEYAMTPEDHLNVTAELDGKENSVIKILMSVKLQTMVDVSMEIA